MCAFPSSRGGGPTLVGPLSRPFLLCGRPGPRCAPPGPRGPFSLRSARSVPACTDTTSRADGHFPMLLTRPDEHSRGLDVLHAPYSGLGFSPLTRASTGLLVGPSRPRRAGVGGQGFPASANPPGGPNWIPVPDAAAPPTSPAPPLLQPVPPGSLAAALEDVSPPPTVLGSSVGDLDEPRRDPFAASSLQGFSLSSVGSVLTARPIAEGPATKEASLWIMVRTVGEGRDRLCRLPHDKTEWIDQQESHADFTLWRTVGPSPCVPHTSPVW